MYIKIIQVICNLGLSKYFYNQFTCMGLWFIGVLNVTERNHWMTLNTAFIYTYNIH